MDSCGTDLLSVDIISDYKNLSDNIWCLGVMEQNLCIAISSTCGQYPMNHSNNGNILSLQFILMVIHNTPSMEWLNVYMNPVLDIPKHKFCSITPRHQILAGKVLLSLIMSTDKRSVLQLSIHLWYDQRTNILLFMIFQCSIRFILWLTFWDWYS